jgi:hypothetical protein
MPFNQVYSIAAEAAHENAQSDNFVTVGDIR